MSKGISQAEFQARWRRLQAGLARLDLDAALVHSNEADFANVRYLSDYWPIFESAGVFVPRQGEPILLIGPESETFAASHSRIPGFRMLLEYRESAEPEYPTIPVASFREVFREGLKGRKLKRLGIIGHSIFPAFIQDKLREEFPGLELVKADQVIFDLRAIKSPAEIDLLRRGFRISERAVARVIAELAPGRTELEMVGTAQAAIYQGGGEYEAHPVYVLAGRHSTHAIGRPTHRRIRSGEVVQLNIGARVAGYSPSVGRPVFVGRITPEARRLFQQGLDLHRKTIELMKAGVTARSVVEKFYDYAGKLGCRQNLLYGPCHGLGLIEVERPWMEETSDYRLREQMTFQVDTFLYNRDFGLRWEDGAVITRDGVDELSSRLQRIIQV